MDSQLAFGASYIPPRVQIENVMGSYKPFGFHFNSTSAPPKLPPLPQLNPLPHLHPISGLSGLPP